MRRLVVEQRRGGALEAAHPVSAVLVDRVGRVRERIGAEVVTTWRSAAKPFQLEVSAALTGLDLAPEDLALGAASHSAEPAHVARVADLLERLGAAEADLLCGAHWPVHRPSAQAVEAPRALHNNCSGKHAFMIGASRRQGWPADYRVPDHPLQVRIAAQVSRRAEIPAPAVVDGCGVPCFVLPLSAMAHAWAALARDEGLLGTIGRAMAAHPWWTAGTGRVETVAMEAGGGALVAKVGAAGLICGALLEEGSGFALKAHSGSPEARAVAFGALLARWAPGLHRRRDFEPWTLLRNVVGRPVGERVVRWS